METIQMRNSINTNGLVELINDLPSNITMAEIGCYVGESTKMFMESGKVNKLFAIDIWEDNLGIYKKINQNHNFRVVENKFDENLKDFNIVKLKMTSEDALSKLPELDMVYIDGNHNYEFVKKDIEMSLLKLKPNSVICGHDYNSDSPGVIQAVNEIFGKPDRIYSDSSWMIILKKMEIVNCTEEYWEFIRLLRMDERVIDGFIKTTPITEQQQKEYMSIYSDNYKVALFDGKPAGYIGVIDDDIRVCTHPDFQRKGVGKFMVNECVKIWENAFAKIKTDNEISLKLFKSCGFKVKYYLLEKE